MNNSDKLYDVNAMVQHAHTSAYNANIFVKRLRFKSTANDATHRSIHLNISNCIDNCVLMVKTMVRMQ